MDKKLNNRITFARKSSRLTQKELAKLLEISEPTMNHYETGKRVPNAELLDKMVALLKCDPGWLLTGNGPAASPRPAQGTSSQPTDSEAMAGEFVFVPQYDLKTAGTGDNIQSSQIVDHLAFKRDWVLSDLKIDPSRLMLVSAVGDSMEPTVRTGDLLLVDRSPKSPLEDGIYLIQIEQSLSVKRLERRMDGSVTVRGDNLKASKEELISEKEWVRLKSIGKVVWMGRKV